MSLGDRAVELHAEKLNCAQCVLLSCSDLDEDIAKKIASGFGSGMRSGEMCGAVSGAIMTLGLKSYDASVVKEFVNDFRVKFGCVRCIELKTKGIPCDDLIKYAADAVEKLMENK